MFEDVAVIHELAHDVRVAKIDDQLDLAWRRTRIGLIGNVHVVLVTHELAGNAVHLGDLKVGLVYVERMPFARRIEDGPFFDRPTPHRCIHAGHVELHRPVARVDVEIVAIS